MQNPYTGQYDLAMMFVSPSIAPSTIAAITRSMDPLPHDPPPAPPARGWEPWTHGYGEMVREFFARAWAEEYAEEESILPYRLFVAWRIVREIARHKGYITHDMALEEGLPLCGHPDPWATPAEAVADQGVALDALVKHELSRSSDIALLPPVPQHPDPWSDPAVMAYHRVVSRVVKNLGISHGSVLDPDLGRLGLKGMLSPETAYEVFPSPQQIQTFEMLLIEETLKSLMTRGIAQTRRYLWERYGLTNLEIGGLLSQARRFASLLTEATIEEHRGMLMMKLEDLANRTRVAGDLKAELGVLKTIATVTGVTRVEDGDSTSEMMKAIQNVANRRREPAASLPPPKHGSVQGTMERALDDTIR